MKAKDTYDEWLILRIKTGDKAAFKLLTERWYAKLAKHIYYLVKDKEVAKDIAQDTWTAIIQKLHTLKEPRLFKYWIFKIARNKSADWIRNEQKRRTVKQEIGKDELAQIDSDSDSDSDITKLRLALRKLPETKREILDLFYLDNCDIREISQALEIPVGTVKSRLFSAREHLKTILKEKK